MIAAISANYTNILSWNELNIHVTISIVIIKEELKCKIYNFNVTHRKMNDKLIQQKVAC
jgi:hypothetical protein